MKFTKMQGTGNDFIILNNIELNIPVEEFSGIAKKVCERRVSVGGDALMVVDRPEKGGDFQMRFYNSDGTIGEMCGNGARCIARYAYENKIADESMVIETLAGDVSAWRMDKRKYKVRLNNPEVIKLDSNVSIDGMEYECSYIELGNPGLPHAVVKLEGLAELDEKKLFELGSKIRNYKEFPKGANVNFYEIIKGNDVKVKTFERGVEDFTLACGTGSGSTATILTLKGVVEKGQTVNLHVPGGILSVNVELNEQKVENLYLMGDTNIVAVGEIMDEDLMI
nr:diaminopimelate epimerase [uncultured Aminipila sp.]